MMAKETPHNQRVDGEVAYPYAYSPEADSLIHISSAPRERGRQYSCVGCGQRMSAVVQVTGKAPHFRHIGDRCTPNNALHTTAIKLIQQKHGEAVSANDRYMLQRHCKRSDTEIDLADGWMCSTEESITPHTRSDVVFTREDGNRIVVEVVVGHEMESETEEVYRSADIPVAVLRPQWETLECLEDGLRIDDSLNFCKSCDTAKNEKEYAATYQRRQDIVNTALGRMSEYRWEAWERRYLRKEPIINPSWWLSPAMCDCGRQAERKVLINARILAELRFERHIRKPWLFRYTIDQDASVFLYANLGYKDSYHDASIMAGRIEPYNCVCPVETAAMLYPTLSLYDEQVADECYTSPSIADYLVESASQWLEECGVGVRTDFMDMADMLECW